MAIFLSLRCKTLRVAWRATPRWTTSARCDWVFPLTKHCSATRLVSLLRLPHNVRSPVSSVRQRVHKSFSSFINALVSPGSNWELRPLPDPHIQYAALDAWVLLALLGHFLQQDRGMEARSSAESHAFVGLTESSLIASRAFQEKAELCELARVSVSSAAT